MIFAIAAQKGGVGKTSIAVHLAGVYAQKGSKVLLIDLDPQHSLTSTFVKDPYQLKLTMKDLLLDADVLPREATIPTSFNNISLIPCNLSLGLAEQELMTNTESQYVLLDKLQDYERHYGKVFIDCPPSLGIFTKLGIVSCQTVIVPLECSMYALKSTEYLLQFIKSATRRANTGLEVFGYLLNRVDARRTIEKDFRDAIRERFGGKVFITEIKNAAKYAEAVTLRMPIGFYKPKSEEAKAYERLYDEIEGRLGNTKYWAEECAVCGKWHNNISTNIDIAAWCNSQRRNKAIVLDSNVRS